MIARAFLFVVCAGMAACGGSSAPADAGTDAGLVAPMPYDCTRPDLAVRLNDAGTSSDPVCVTGQSVCVVHEPTNPQLPFGAECVASSCTNCECACSRDAGIVAGCATEVGCTLEYGAVYVTIGQI